MTIHLARRPVQEIADSTRESKTDVLTDRRTDGRETIVDSVIECSCTPDGTSLVVTDDGEGIPDPLPETGGMGQRIMRYRAQLIGGTLDISRGAEGGTVVRCEVKGDGR